MNKMAQQEKPVIQWDKIFNISVKLTCPYFLGIMTGSKLGQPVQWIDIMFETFVFLGACYGLGVTGNFIYNQIQSIKAKRAAKLKNTQNGR